MASVVRDPHARDHGARRMTASTTPPSTDVDETGEASFPASDPPAVWTWDVAPAPDREMGTDTHVPVDAARVA
jgi:hypothetical protein